MSDFLFSRRRDGTYRLDTYEGAESTVVIPSSFEGKPVTSIADNAFSWSFVRKVIIPDSVTQIGEAAFSWCESLISVEIPDTVKIIGEWAFIGCSSLKSIHLPDGLRKINYSTFQSCSSLVSIEIAVRFSLAVQRFLLLSLPRIILFFAQRTAFSLIKKING